MSKKKSLLAGAAFAALSLLPLTSSQALAEDVDLEIESEWRQDLDVAFEWIVEVAKSLNIFGFVDDGEEPVIPEPPDPVTVTQVTIDESLELDGTPDQNTVNVDVDIADVETSPTGVNEQDGEFNLQGNVYLAPPTGDGAGSTVVQGLLSSTLNIDSAELNSTPIENIANVNVTSTGETNGNAGLNATAGVFNIQANSGAITQVAAGDLAAANATLTQFAQQDANVQHDTTNDLNTTIVLDSVVGNVGVNVSTGAGNMQSNSATIVTPF